MALFATMGDRLANTRRLARHFGWIGEIRRKRESIRWMRHVPFLLMHLTPLLILFVGASWVAVLVAFLFWFVRKFAITGFYHRYFSHRAFKTSRAMQFVMALWGSSAVQKASTSLWRSRGSTARAL